jgi:hypothetical protein
MGFKETRAYLEQCISRSALACPFGFAAGRNKLCVCVCIGIALVCGRESLYWPSIKVLIVCCLPPRAIRNPLLLAD